MYWGSRVICYFPLLDTYVSNAEKKIIIKKNTLKYEFHLFVCVEKDMYYSTGFWDYFQLFQIWQYKSLFLSLLFILPIQIRRTAWAVHISRNSFQPNSCSFLLKFFKARIPCCIIFLFVCLEKKYPIPAVSQMQAIASFYH